MRLGRPYGRRGAFFSGCDLPASIRARRKLWRPRRLCRQYSAQALAPYSCLINSRERGSRLARALDKANSTKIMHRVEAAPSEALRTACWEMIASKSGVGSGKRRARPLFAADKFDVFLTKYVTDRARMSHAMAPFSQCP